MNYFEELDAWLTSVLLVTEDDESEEAWFTRVKKQLKDKILLSYRNGQKAGPRSPAPDKKTTRKSFFRKANQGPRDE